MATKLEKAWDAFRFTRDQLIKSRVYEAKGISSGARSQLFKEANEEAVGAIAQAAVDAFKADTLGLLEAIVHKGRYIEYMDGKQALLVWRTPTGRLTYQIDLVHVTRNEAAALLAGKEKKE
jgi:hypothetical protein